MEFSNLTLWNRIRSLGNRMISSSSKFKHLTPPFSRTNNSFWPKSSVTGLVAKRDNPQIVLKGGIRAQ